MEEKETPLILIPISKTISLEEIAESIPSSLPIAKPFSEYSTTYNQFAIEDSINKPLKSQNYSLNQIPQTSFGNENPDTISTDQCKPYDQINFANEAKELEKSSSIRKSNP